MNRRRYQRQLQQYTGVIDQVACSQSIAAVEHVIIIPQQVHRVVGAQLQIMGDDADLRVQCAQPSLRGQGLACANLAGVEQQLTLQVG